MNLDKVLVWNIVDKVYMKCERSRRIHVSVWKKNIRFDATMNEKSSTECVKFFVVFLKELVDFFLCVNF